MMIPITQIGFTSGFTWCSTFCGHRRACSAGHHRYGVIQMLGLRGFAELHTIVELLTKGGRSGHSGLDDGLFAIPGLSLRAVRT